MYVLLEKSYIFFLSLGVIPSESDALHLPITHVRSLDIAICHDDYKFIAYPNSIFQKFAVDDEMMVRIHFESLFRNCEKVARSTYLFL